jgi:hypothetical protein
MLQRRFVGIAMTWRACGLLWLFMCIVVTGCGSRYTTAEISGKVEFDGRPMVGGGQIMFVPLREEDGKASVGEIRPDGTFSLTTYQKGDGAVLGEHRVEVWQETIVSYAQYKYERSDKGEKQILIAPEKKLAAADVIPAFYCGPESPLRYTVSDQKEDVTISLSRTGSTR